MLPLHGFWHSMSGKHSTLAKHASSCGSHFCAKHKSHGLVGSEPGQEGAHNVPEQLDAIVNSANPVAFVT